LFCGLGPGRLGSANRAEHNGVDVAAWIDTAAAPSVAAWPAGLSAACTIRRIIGIDVTAVRPANLAAARSASRAADNAIRAV